MVEVGSELSKIGEKRIVSSEGKKKRKSELGFVVVDYREDEKVKQRQVKKANAIEDRVTMSWSAPDDIFFSTSLAAYLDKKLLVLLRDGRKLMGLLRSFDQFANAVLEEAYERVIVGDLYCDIPLGLYIIRGENVVLIGELDIEKEELPAQMIQVSESEIKRAQKAEKEEMMLKGTMRKRMEFLDLD